MPEFLHVATLPHIQGRVVSPVRPLPPSMRAIVEQMMPDETQVEAFHTAETFAKETDAVISGRYCGAANAAHLRTAVGRKGHPGGTDAAACPGLLTAQQQVCTGAEHCMVDCTYSTVAWLLWILVLAPL